MSFNHSLNFGYFTQTSVYSQNGANSPAATLQTAHMSKNLKVKTYPRWYNHIGVEWEVPEDWGAVTFNVYFSPIEDGEWEKLNVTPIDGTFILDNTTQEYMKFNRGFYVVEAILADRNNITIRSPAVSWEAFQRRWVELRSIEIQRREYWLLSHFVGVKSYLFRRKTYGLRCPECWSNKTEKLIKDHCTTCFGTSFKGGYFDAAPIYGQYDATPNQNQKTYFGQYEPNQIGMWTISMPDVRPGDLIMRSGDWNLYRVERLTNTELQTNTVRQICVLTQLAKSDVEYQLLSRTLPDFTKDLPQYKDFTGTGDFPEEFK